PNRAAGEEHQKKQPEPVQEAERGARGFLRRRRISEQTARQGGGDLAEHEGTENDAHRYLADQAGLSEPHTGVTEEVTTSNQDRPRDENGCKLVLRQGRILLKDQRVEER